jgi:hypothetical protein
MPLTLELPAPLEENLKQEAQKEGVPATEHAAFLLSVLMALLQEKEATSFRNAVRTFFSYHSLDAEQVATVFEELVEQSFQSQEKGKTSAEFQQASESLRAWRNWHVHQPIDEPREMEPLQPLHRRLRKSERTGERETAMGKYAHVPGSSEDFAREKQEEIAREDRRGSEPRP